MEIVFKRRLTNELLTTYLPSFLLLLMSYATTFFKPFYFEAAVTVNLSILLVTTTLFIRWIHMKINNSSHQLPVFSVMGKLPATSYVRMVDIWLIFTQLVPFIEETNFKYRFACTLNHLYVDLYFDSKVENQVCTFDVRLFCSPLLSCIMKQMISSTIMDLRGRFLKAKRKIIPRKLQEFSKLQHLSWQKLFQFSLLYSPWSIGLMLFTVMDSHKKWIDK